ncbi:MAG: sugar ABC transporter substrate-binding protein [Acetobacteraceae bacterium]|nr:sugar ABC transporter substrate-binding protein [Acetobacteraceae bacterium]
MPTGSGPALRRRAFLGLAGALSGAVPPALAAPGRPVSVAFANITEDPAQRLEGTGFTGAAVRESFALAARRLPAELSLYDNAMDPAKALANAEDAIRRRVDVYVLYGWDEGVNAAVAERLGEAGVKLLSISRPAPGAPLYTADNATAGRIGGEALARYAAENWPERRISAVIIGPPADPMNRLAERADGIAAGLRSGADAPARLETDVGARKVDALLRRFLDAHGGRKVLIAALDDATALAAKDTVDEAGRQSDVAIVGQGCDRSMHGNASEHKLLDPTNRGSIVLGSVAFFLDRYGYDVLPLAVALASGKPVAERTVTEHQLITPANAFRIYPPIDIN